MKNELQNVIRNNLNDKTFIEELKSVMKKPEAVVVIPDPKPVVAEEKVASPIRTNASQSTGPPVMGNFKPFGF